MAPVTTEPLADQVAIVTGGGRGIGRAIALALADAGAAVAVVARSETQVTETTALIEHAGGRAVACVADITDEAAMVTVVRTTEGHLGPVTILVNNAGRGSVIGPVWEADAAEWWRDIEVNLRGTFLCSRAVLPSMIAGHRGRIINVSSNFGTQPVAYGSAYGSSKAALLYLSNTLAAEVKPYGIAVFVINPGIVQTEMSVNLASSEAGRRWLPWFEAALRDRQVPAERAAQLVVCLAAGHADRLSGRYLGVADDLAALVQCAEKIEQNDLYALRIRSLPENV